MNKQPSKVKCYCGKHQEVSNSGWTVYSVRDGRKTVNEVNWLHVVAHFGTNGKMCNGIEMSAVEIGKRAVK